MTSKVVGGGGGGRRGGVEVGLYKVSGYAFMKTQVMKFLDIKLKVKRSKINT